MYLCLLKLAGLPFYFPVPLRVQISPTTLVVDVRRSATLRCLVEGTPVTAIQWFRNGEKLVDSASAYYGANERSRYELLQCSIRMPYKLYLKKKDILVPYFKVILLCLIKVLRKHFFELRTVECHVKCTRHCSHTKVT